jgi:hypothetical protein
MRKTNSAKRSKSNAVANDRTKQPAAAKHAGRRQARDSSKQAKVIELLSQPKGTTVTAIMKATGWKQHSVHGFLSGVVRKKLSFNLESDKTGGEHTYRIVNAKTVRKPKIENRNEQAA